MMERGYVRVGRVRGVPIRLHWTLPLGALLLGGGRVVPGLWLGVLALVALHEAGHALLVHRFGLVNLGIDLSALGGRCRWTGEPSALERSAIAWGGVLAQLVVLVPALVVSMVVELPSSGFLAELMEALTRANLILIAINLLPVPPLDGAEAWPFFRHALRERARKKAWKRKLTEEPKTLGQALAEADEQAGGRRR